MREKTEKEIAIQRILASSFDDSEFDHRIMELVEKDLGCDYEGADRNER